MKKDYPRVLVINGDPFNKSTATGITLCNLFKGWPKEAISQIFVFNVEPDTSVCDRYWKISDSVLPVMTWLKKAKRLLSALSNTEMAPATAVARVGSVIQTTSPNPVLGAWADTIPLHIPEQLWTWIGDTKPDVIYTQLVNIRVMGLVQRVAHRFSLPIIPHFMDDWPTTRYDVGIMTIIPRYVLLSRMRSILSKTKVGMTISNAMALEYNKRYQINFESFMNCVDFSELSPDIIPRIGKVVRFGYVGGLHLNRWQSLLEIGEALTMIKSTGVAVEMTIYAPVSDLHQYGKMFSALNAVVIGGSLAADEILPKLQTFDVLIHIESFDASERVYTHFSISTKIPQYMASGRPIVAYGPPEVASCRYIESSLCGLVVGKKDTLLLRATLEKISMEPDQRSYFGENSRCTAEKNHNAIIERERFKAFLSKITKNVSYHN